MRGIKDYEKNREKVLNAIKNCVLKKDIIPLPMNLIKFDFIPIYKSNWGKTQLNSFVLRIKVSPGHSK